MASSSSSGASGGSSDNHSNNMINSPGSDQDAVHDGQTQCVDQIRKRKRMQSNRESARRSRMRKQKHLDDLMAQVGELKKDNSQILTSVNITTQLYVRVEAENAVLRAQLSELTNSLQSLNDIINCISITSGNCMLEDNNNNNNNSFSDNLDDNKFDHDHIINNGNEFSHVLMMPMTMMNNNPWNSIPLNQPIMASADQMCMY